MDKVAQLESNNTFKESQLVVGQISYSEHTIFFVLLKRRFFVFETLHITPRRHTSLTLASSRRSDSRAGKKNSRRKKKEGETRGGKGEGTPVNIPLQSSFRP